MTRDEIFNTISLERAYQEKKWGTTFIANITNI
jgi:hypothetical protein